MALRAIDVAGVLAVLSLAVFGVSKLSTVQAVPVALFCFLYSLTSKKRRAVRELYDGTSAWRTAVNKWRSAAEEWEVSAMEWQATAKIHEDRAVEAEAQLEAIDSVNEDDWENGEAATWVAEIRNGKSLADCVKDGMVTQEAHEEAYFGGADPLGESGG